MFTITDFSNVYMKMRSSLEQVALFSWKIAQAVTRHQIHDFSEVWPITEMNCAVEITLLKVFHISWKMMQCCRST